MACSRAWPRSFATAPLAGFSWGGALASRAMLAVIPDYHVYPQVRYPVFLEDGARSLAWTRRQLGGWGGDPARLFVAAHSAGAYNAAMLALDPKRNTSQLSGRLTLQPLDSMRTALGPGTDARGLSRRPGAARIDRRPARSSA